MVIVFTQLGIQGAAIPVRHANIKLICPQVTVFHQIRHVAHNYPVTKEHQLKVYLAKLNT
jgi:NhaP-type Na+/H+ and K+/H+ antiporter